MDLDFEDNGVIRRLVMPTLYNLLLYYYLIPAVWGMIVADFKRRRRISPKAIPFMYTCRQILHEASVLFYKENYFDFVPELGNYLPCRFFWAITSVCKVSLDS